MFTGRGPWRGSGAINGLSETGRTLAVSQGSCHARLRLTHVHHYSSWADKQGHERKGKKKKKSPALQSSFHPSIPPLPLNKVPLPTNQPPLSPICPPRCCRGRNDLPPQVQALLSSVPQTRLPLLVRRKTEAVGDAIDFLIKSHKGPISAWGRGAGHNPRPRFRLLLSRLFRDLGAGL